MAVTRVAFCVLIAVAVVHGARLPRDSTTKFTTKYDNVNLDEILKSDRLLQSYTKCLLDKGKCTPDGLELKRVLPDALLHNCSQCSERQRSGTERVVRHLINKKPDIYRDLEAKYDPTGIYRKKYATEFGKLF